jgi:hypothetical protein
MIRLVLRLDDHGDREAPGFSLQELRYVNRRIKDFTPCTGERVHVERLLTVISVIDGKPLPFFANFEPQKLVWVARPCRILLVPDSALRHGGDRGSFGYGNTCTLPTLGVRGCDAEILVKPVMGRLRHGHPGHAPRDQKEGKPRHHLQRTKTYLVFVHFLVQEPC